MDGVFSSGGVVGMVSAWELEVVIVCLSLCVLSLSCFSQFLTLGMSLQFQRHVCLYNIILTILLCHCISYQTMDKENGKYLFSYINFDGRSLVLRFQSNVHNDGSDNVLGCV